MKRMKKWIAFVISMIMVISTISMSFADNATGALNVNGVLTVQGLDKGDKVTYYHIVKWDSAASEQQGYSKRGWVWGDDIKSSGSTLTQNDLNQITGMQADGSYKDGAGRITAEIAGKIAENVTGGHTSDPITGTEWTETVDKAGLYMIVVEPAAAGTIYNPIFVAANWYGSSEIPDSSNTIAVSANKPTYFNEAMAKKTKIPVDKKAKGKDAENGEPKPGDPTNNALADGAYTTDAGEEIDFEVTTHVPKYASNYTQPVFKVVDTLTGLALTGANVKVYKYDPETGEKGVELSSSYYDITGNAKGSTTYTVSFKPEYMQGSDIPVTGQDVMITYTAKVTDQAEYIVNQEKNTVDVRFSTKPSDTTGAGLLRDETNHFTFSLDADLLGHGEIDGSSTEAIKVGVDQDGNYIITSEHYEWSDEWHGPLQGAEFSLYKDAECQNLYTNSVFNGTVTSDASGRLTIKGLDAGTYYLKETKAPEGYIKLQETIKIVIEADITEEETVEKKIDQDGIEVEITYKTNKLNGYTVTIGTDTVDYGTTAYQINYNAEVSATSADRIKDSSTDAELKNTKGVELPSTGGMGTTIFYIIGSILVVGAGILLVTRRRMSEM